MTDYDNSSPRKRRRGIDRFDDVYDDRGLAFREIFTRDREGPLQPRPPGKGGPSLATAPANFGAPVASGSLTIGSTLSTTNGTWTGSPTFTYQWLRNGVNIAGATLSTYTTVTADGGTTVSCRVTATNARGSASATSNGLAIAVVSSVWTAADATAGGMTLSNGGLTVTSSGAAAWNAVRGTISKSTGKLYCEFKMGAVIANSDANNQFQVGFADATFSAVSGNYLGSVNFSTALVVNFGTMYGSTGFTPLSTTVHTGVVIGDILMTAIDFSAGKIWIGVNNIFPDGSPSAGTTPTMSFTPATVGALFPAMAFNGGVDISTIQPTAASQTFAPPSGFSAWG